MSGIWPPDVGGPASHAPELAAFLEARRHGVEVVTTADAEPEPCSYPVHHVRRSLPAGVRHAAVAAEVARRARRADVVYATSMLRRAAAGAGAARRPLVVKVPTDEAFERARREGRFDGDMDEFQKLPGDARIRALRWTRTAALRRARHAFFPSAYLRAFAIDWGLDPARTSVLRNPFPDLPELAPRDELRADLGLDGPTLVLAARLTTMKAVPVALEALEHAAGVTLLVAGDGPDREALERESARRGLAGCVRFLGPQPRDEVLRLFRAADGALLSSAWENFPHTVVEALAVGTPVIATSVGGVPEVVRDGVNGILVPPGDAVALSEAIRRFAADDALRARLAAEAAPSVVGYEPEHVYGTIERVLAEVARG